MKSNRTTLILIAISFISCSKAKKFENYQVFPIMGGSIVINQELLELSMQDNVTKFNVYRENNSSQMRTIIGGYNGSFIQIYSVDGSYYEGIDGPSTSIGDHRNDLFDILRFTYSDLDMPYDQLIDTIVDGNPCTYLIQDTCIIIAHNADNKVVATVQFYHYQSNYTVSELLSNYYLVLP